MNKYIYAALLLHSVKQPISADGIRAVITAVGGSVDDVSVKYYVAVFGEVDIEKTLAEIPKPTPVPLAVVTPQREESPEKKEPEDTGFAKLFGSN